jgi:hypothetical protein
VHGVVCLVPRCKDCGTITPVYKSVYNTAGKGISKTRELFNTGISMSKPYINMAVNKVKKIMEVRHG